MGYDGWRRHARYWLPWLVGMPAEISRAICSLIFAGVFERLKQLRMCFAHGGGSFPATLDVSRLVSMCGPIIPPIDNPHSPRRYLNKIYFDSLVHEPAKLDYLLKLVGADQIALGSDYPFPLGEAEPGKLIDSCDYQDDIKAMLFHGAALNWLDLEESASDDLTS